MPAISTLPSSDVDLFADDVLTDPYPTYRHLRDLGPAVALSKYDTVVLSRYADVRHALASWDSFSSAEGVGLEDEMNARRKGTVIASDPPQHDRLRAVLSEKLAPRGLAKLRTDIEARADQMVRDTLHRHLAGGRADFDAVTDLVETFPVTVVADLLGLPSEGRDQLLENANAAFNTFGPMNERLTSVLPAVFAMYEYIANVMVPAKLHPDGWAVAVFDAADRGEIEHESVVPLLAAYTTASMDTTINGVVSALQLLAEHPHLYAELRAEPALVGSVFEEALRLESPAQSFFRVTTTDVPVDDAVIPARTRVLLSYASANRDERKWEEPTTFDIRRNPVDHLAFGYGLHGCAGQGLARMEARAFLGAFVRQVATLELRGQPTRRLNNITRGLSRMPVTVTLA